MTENKTFAMRWVILAVASLMLIVSTLYRLIEGKEADSGLCWMFVSVGGLIFGAKLIEVLKK
jgi:Co/Zn/Cd efflux system component